jgi:hypothetical protein
MKLAVRPLLFTTGTFLLAAAIVIVFVERPLSFTSFKEKNFSAIAIRDNVSSFEKRGSALFTIPYLKKFYNDFYYLEANKDWIPAREFVPYAEKLLQHSDSLDVYILSHGNLFYQWFYSMDSVSRKKIRLVYNTGCANDSQCVVYRDFGIKNYVGHSGENSLSPVFYIYFLRRMFTTTDLKNVVSRSNERTEKVLNYFISDADTISGSLGNWHSEK